VSGVVSTDNVFADEYWAPRIHACRRFWSKLPTAGVRWPATKAQRTVVACLNGNVGRQFEEGGEGPKLFDAPGIARFCQMAAGVQNISAGVEAMSRGGAQVLCTQAQPGDLVFFGSPPTDVATFVSGTAAVDARRETGVTRTEDILVTNSAPRMCRRYLENPPVDA
jgi:hypothetical protein